MRKNKKPLKSTNQALRNSELSFSCALGFADKTFFQGLYVFYLRRGIGSSTFRNKLGDLVKWIRCFYSQRLK